MELDPVLLSRVQFAFVISFHIIFPAFTIGLAAWLATLEGVRLLTGNQLYRRIFDFWLKIFALSFGMGVVSGIVMAFQFGTNWSVMAERTGSIQGPLLGYEAFTAFMLEATFFGVVLLGRDRVPPWFYFLSCCMVSLGTMFSSFWILANNSWMQVPLGHTIVDGRIIPADWWAITTGPIMRVRWPHMLLAAFLTTGMCVAATGAWYLLRGKDVPESRAMLHWGLGLVAVLIPIQLFFGHLTGLYVLQASACEVRGDRGALEDPAAGKRGADRSARSIRGAESLCDRNPQARQLHRLRQLDRARDWVGDLPARRPPTGDHSLFRVSRHGGNGLDNARGILVWKLSALARPAGEHSLVSVGGVPILPERLHRRSRRLVYRRSRPPALGSLRPSAHEGCCNAVFDDG